MWWRASVTCVLVVVVVSCVGLQGVDGAPAPAPIPAPEPAPAPAPEPAPAPKPDPFLLYAAYPSWAAQMFGTAQEVGQAAAQAMTQRTQTPAATPLVFRPGGVAAQPLVAIRNVQAPPQHLAVLRRPTALNVQLLQRPVLPPLMHYQPVFLPSLHLRPPYYTMPYTTRFSPQTMYYPTQPSFSVAHSRPAHLDYDEDDDDDDDDDDEVMEVVVQPAYVRVASFPQQLPSLFSLRAEGEDAEPVAPAGIAQALQPTFSYEPFTNAKAHPSLRGVQPADDGAVVTA